MDSTEDYTSRIDYRIFDARQSVELCRMRIRIPLFVAALAAAGSIYGQQPPAQQQSEKPKPDRSAEAELVALFEHAGKLRSFTAKIRRSSHFGRFEPFTNDGMTDMVYQGPNRFSIYEADMWGDSFRGVSDGKWALVDRLDGMSPSLLINAPKDIPSLDPALASKGAVSSPLYYLLQGQAGFDQIVKKSGFVKAIKGVGLLDAIEFVGEGFGRVILYYRYDDPLQLVRRIEYDNSEAFAEMAAADPEDFFGSTSDFMVRHDIEYHGVNEAINPGLFDCTPPKGVPVDDKRTQRGRIGETR